MTTLDSAFLRHGRFDYVLPPSALPTTGPGPLRESYPARAGAEADNAALASASEGFTPADIAHVARTVSQARFEHTVDIGTRARPTTDDYVETVGATQPTVSSTMAQEFSDQSDRFARVRRPGSRVTIAQAPERSPGSPRPGAHVTRAAQRVLRRLLQHLAPATAAVRIRSPPRNEMCWKRTGVRYETRPGHPLCRRTPTPPRGGTPS
ncbi:hypothetical protein ABZV67_17195 [Streptomyces sp. NPDC005065]|uniref:hypothetical protein n=1 Tax=Streptomyces sp. NPDC005065 TaxID=3154461 RepID=UPI0033AE2524